MKCTTTKLDGHFVPKAKTEIKSETTYDDLEREPFLVVKNCPFYGR